MISLRASKPEDLDSISDVYAATHMIDPQDVKLEPVGDSQQVQIFCAENEDQKIIGAITARIAGKHGVISKLAILDQYRRQGTASKLLKMAEDWLHQRNAKLVFVYVFQDNDTAKQFYQNNAYDLRPLQVYKKAL